jgi:hypothetical protein
VFAALALLALGAAQLPVRAQPPASPALEDLGEGALDNDVFLPRAAAVEAQLARGDERLAALRADRNASAQGLERAWTEVFEAWFAAAEAAQAGDAVVLRPWTSTQPIDSPWPDPDGTAGGGADDRLARRRESYEDALVRRVAALEPELRAAWSARFAPLAEDARAAAGARPAALARTLARFPATPGAVRAALALAELELEAGRDAHARTWLARAELQAELAAADDLRAALARRRALPALAAVAPRAPGEGEAWDAAAGLRLVGEVALEDLSGRTRVFVPRPGEHAASGLAWLPDGNVLVQTLAAAVLIDPREARSLLRIDPLALLAPTRRSVTPLDPPRAAPGWPMQPAVAADGRCVLVLRSEPSVVLCLRVVRGGDAAALPQARLEWARVGVERFDGTGGARVDDREPWPAGDVQPGPLVLDDRVLLGVQGSDDSGAGRRGAWLLALDLADGAVQYSRLVARGLPFDPHPLRFGGGDPPPGAAQPLSLAGERALVTTHLGASACFDAADGRLAWSLATRRRPAGSDGWSGARTVVFEGGALLAPADSDRLYVVRGAADLAGAGLFLAPPQPIGEALALEGGDARSALVLARSGRERGLTHWQLDSGARAQAPWLAPGETFTGSAAVSPRRALLATQRALYLHDRTRELFLLDQVPYPRDFAGAGGPVFARGDRVLVVGPHLAWVFAPR